eukprot:356118-Chlamydomonas_euryale.AAC.2
MAWRTLSHAGTNATSESPFARLPMKRRKGAPARCARGVTSVTSATSVTKLIGKGGGACQT